MRNPWIIELEQGVYLAEGEGDPPRTLQRDFAARYRSAAKAATALRNARKFRPFADAIIRCRMCETATTKEARRDGGAAIVAEPPNSNPRHSYIFLTVGGGHPRPFHPSEVVTL